VYKVHLPSGPTTLQPSEHIAGSHLCSLDEPRCPAATASCQDIAEANLRSKNRKSVQGSGFFDTDLSSPCLPDPSPTLNSPTPGDLILTLTRWLWVPLNWPYLMAIDFWFSKASPVLWLNLACSNCLLL
jgi:hypothetical protein